MLFMQRFVFLKVGENKKMLKRNKNKKVRKTFFYIHGTHKN